VTAGAGRPGSRAIRRLGSPPGKATGDPACLQAGALFCVASGSATVHQLRRPALTRHAGDGTGPARRGAGNNRAVSTAPASNFLNTAGKVGWVTISERIAAARRERRVLARVCRAAWRLEQAERERVWALVSARAEGISIRTLAAAAGLSRGRPSKPARGNGLGKGRVVSFWGPGSPSRKTSGYG
jgi:hypothetical protein